MLCRWQSHDCWQFNWTLINEGTAATNGCTKLLIAKEGRNDSKIGIEKTNGRTSVSDFLELHKNCLEYDRTAKRQKKKSSGMIYNI